MYGVPHGWGANLLMYNTDVVSPAPTSWGAVFDESSDYAGKVTAYDSPIYIADAALYLMKTQPDLGIKDPYALDQDQLDAAVELLKQQNENVGEYWSDYLKQDQAFTNGDSVIGTTWQFIANLAQAEGVPVEVTLPEEGATGWSDTWMVGADAQNPNCAYAWVDYITSPEPQAAGRGVVRRGAGQHPGLLTDVGQEVLRHLPRRGRRLRRADLLLDHADRAVPRRPDRREVHGLRRLDPGVDRGQGLIVDAGH